MPMVKKSQLGVMITPGIHDNDSLPSAGSMANSGIALDLSAINTNEFYPYNTTNNSDDGHFTMKRAPDFAETGTYLILTPQGLKKIYRDPENREWYEDCDKHYSQSWLGSTKAEAM